jgi:hypothetical protein
VAESEGSSVQGEREDVEQLESVSGQLKRVLNDFLRPWEGLDACRGLQKVVGRP